MLSFTPPVQDGNPGTWQPPIIHSHICRSAMSPDLAVKKLLCHVNSNMCKALCRQKQGSWPCQTEAMNPASACRAEYMSTGSHILCCDSLHRSTVPQFCCMYYDFLLFCRTVQMTNLKSEPSLTSDNVRRRGSTATGTETTASTSSANDGAVDSSKFK